MTRCFNCLSKVAPVHTHEARVIVNDSEVSVRVCSACKEAIKDE